MQLNFDRLLVLSFGFFLLFIACGPAGNLAAQVLEDNNFGKLGFYSLALFFVRLVVAVLSVCRS